MTTSPLAKLFGYGEFIIEIADGDNFFIGSVNDNGKCTEWIRLGMSSLEVYVRCELCGKLIHHKIEQHTHMLSCLKNCKVIQEY